LLLQFDPKAKTSGEIMADKGRVQQVVDNILVNAIKFSPDGGTILLTMEEEQDSITVKIADQGIGLPEDKVSRIFERFYQVDGTSRRRFGGAGIGLAIVKRIIDAHKGEIWVESAVNEGSAFYFSLPKTPTI
jgi:signal transduction histidine kinase